MPVRSLPIRPENGPKRWAIKHNNGLAKPGDKAEEWAEAAGNKASATADNLSQKANDFRQTMDNRAEADEQKQAQYAENYRKDVNDLKDRVKNSEKSAN